MRRCHFEIDVIVFDGRVRRTGQFGKERRADRVLPLLTHFDVRRAEKFGEGIAECTRHAAVDKEVYRIGQEDSEIQQLHGKVEEHREKVGLE